MGGDDDNHRRIRGPLPNDSRGRIVAFGLMLGGIALLGVITATLASWIIERVREENDAGRAAT